MVTFAAIVGAAAGLATVILVKLIAFFNNIFFGGGKLLGLPGGFYVIFLPALGGLIGGPLVHFLAPEAKGGGVTEVLQAIIAKGGRIRPIVAVVKAVGTAITIGSGGSVGREGPIVQIGASLGSSIGQFFKLSEQQLVTLLAAGAAAGIASTFNAPIAGVMYATEVILGELNGKYLISMVIATVIASGISRAILGDIPAFAMPAYSINSPWEMLLYLGLGVVAGLGSLLFVRLLYFMENTFEKWSFPSYLKPAAGGLCVGVLGYFLPQVFGSGYDTIANSLAGKLSLVLLIALIFGKIIATSLTLGSGASGGVLTPALFIGAVLGGAYGQLAQMLFPGIPASSGAYAMVGMAAVFAGAVRAPITAIVILFEMTQDYRVILPLMLATVVSTLIAGRLEPDSIDTLKLKQRGIDIKVRRNENLLRVIRVCDAMTPMDKILSVKPDISLTELEVLFKESGHHGFIVLNEQDELYGVVTLSDLERVPKDLHKTKVVGDICTQSVLTIYPDETLNDALRYFGLTDVGRIPVVDRDDPRHVCGVLRRSDIIHSLSMALVEKQDKIQHINKMRMESLIQSELMEILVTRKDWANHKLLSEIPLPDDSVIVTIHRGGEMIVPRGHTQILAGDLLDCFVGNGNVDALKKALHTEPPAPAKKKAVRRKLA